jgi:ubiquinone/menaquinone biosynthesis C-methylase UbiE
VNQSAAEEADAYDRWHSELADDPQSAALHSWHRNVARLLKVTPGSRILEIGCGRGEFSAMLATRYPDSELTAVDFSPKAISIAKASHSRSLPNLRFDVADATSLPYADRSFDVVISCECLEHVLNPQAMTREIHRVLEPGGSYYLTTENYLNAMALMWAKALVTGIPIATGTGTQPHENFFLYWRVKRMLQQSGLSVLHMESEYFQWLMLPRVSPSRLATVDFENPVLKRVFRPFGRHFLFAGTRLGE